MCALESGEFEDVYLGGASVAGGGERDNARGESHDESSPLGGFSVAGEAGSATGDRAERFPREDVNGRACVGACDWRRRGCEGTVGIERYVETASEREGVVRSSASGEGSGRPICRPPCRGEQIGARRDESWLLAGIWIVNRG